MIVRNHKVNNNGIEMGLRNEQSLRLTHLQAAENEHTVAVGPAK